MITQEGMKIIEESKDNGADCKQIKVNMDKRKTDVIGVELEK